MQSLYNVFRRQQEAGPPSVNRQLVEIRAELARIDAGLQEVATYYGPELDYLKRMLEAKSREIRRLTEQVTTLTEQSGQPRIEPDA